MRQQRRGRAIAMSSQELDAYLAAERTCRVATIGTSGPHVVPLWFVWVDGVLWLNSVVKSQRWRDIERHPDIAVVVDSGDQYDELRGVEIIGRAAPVGDVPRGAAPHAELTAVERAYARKYGSTEQFTPDGRHAWLRLTPAKITTWDFRKLAGLTR